MAICRWAEDCDVYIFEYAFPPSKYCVMDGAVKGGDWYGGDALDLLHHVVQLKMKGKHQIPNDVIQKIRRMAELGEEGD